MMMQPNLGCGIIVTLRIDVSMAFAEPMLSSCFDIGPLLNRQKTWIFWFLVTALDAVEFVCPIDQVVEWRW